MSETIVEPMVLTELEAEMFFETVLVKSREVGYQINPKEWDFLYGLDDEDGLVVAFIHENGDKQVDFSRTNKGYVLTFWSGDYIYGDVYLNGKGQITDVQLVQIPVQP